MSEFVVWYDSSETGAPVLNNAAGSLLGVIKACGKTGFNLQSITSLVVAGGVATATCAGHGYSGTYGKDIEIEGATPAGLNGRKALTYVDANTFKFDATGVADGAATGAITAKRAPFGLIELFSGVNKSIFRRADVTASSMLLRIDDTNAGNASATDARALMIEGATDVDTYTGAAPSAILGQYWFKGTNSAMSKSWALAGDGRRFYLLTQSGTSFMIQGFGDFKSFKPGDAYNCFLAGSSSGNGSSNSALGVSSQTPGAANTLVIARPYTQVGSCINSGTLGIGNSASGVATLPVAQSPIDSGCVIYPEMLLVEDSATFGYPPRGVLTGFCQLLARSPFANLQIVDTVVNMPGRKMLALSVTAFNFTGQIGLDITGPWEY